MAEAAVSVWWPFFCLRVLGVKSSSRKAPACRRKARYFELSDTTREAFEFYNS
jgi:hypothetical protein